MGADKRNAPPGETEITRWLVERLSEWLAVSTGSLRVEEPFASYGLSSVGAVSLSGELSEWLKIECSPTVAYEYPTIEALARHLADEARLQAD